MSARFPFPSYPTGWFAVGLSGELPPGGLLTRRCFGREIVVFRTASGAARAVDAYCPHMGAHFGHGGSVEGELLRCPFHGFCYDGDGACVSTPYGSRALPKTALETLVLREAHSLLLLHHDAAGAPPAYPIPELDVEGWTPLRGRSWVLRSHPQETTENSVDLGHFAAVHGYKNARITRPLAADGPLLTIGYAFDTSLDHLGMPGQVVGIDLKISAWGLGYSYTEVHLPAFDMHVRQFLLGTPIDEGTMEYRAAASVLKKEDDALTESLLSLAIDGLARDVEKDFAIWENKRYLKRPALADGDGPIGAYRRWTRQFYAPALDK